MKQYVVSWSEDITLRKKIVIEAKNKDEATELVLEGNYLAEDEEILSSEVKDYHTFRSELN